MTSGFCEKISASGSNNRPPHHDFVNIPCLTLLRVLLHSSSVTESLRPIDHGNDDLHTDQATRSFYFGLAHGWCVLAGRKPSLPASMPTFSPPTTAVQPPQSAIGIGDPSDPSSSFSTMTRVKSGRSVAHYFCDTRASGMGIPPLMWLMNDLANISRSNHWYQPRGRCHSSSCNTAWGKECCSPCHAWSD